MVGRVCISADDQTLAREVGLCIQASCVTRRQGLTLCNRIEKDGKREILSECNCMCACMHIYMYVCMYVCMYIHIYAHTRTNISSVRVNIFTCSLFVLLRPSSQLSCISNPHIR